MATIRNIHVGTRANFSLEESVLVHFHNFENLPQTKGAPVDSPTFVSTAHEWMLRIFPGGGHRSKKGMIAVFLRHESKSSITVDFAITARTAMGHNFKTLSGKGDTFRGQGTSLGHQDYLKRDTALSILDDGTLSFEVRIIPHRNNHLCEVKPRPTLSDSMFNLFLNKDSVDVSFEVGNQLFSAHRVILKARAPQFAELAESCDLMKPMPINDVDPEFFQTMLHFLYDQNICPDTWNKQSKQLLEASGKYGITELKSEAEAWYVKDINLSVENVIGELLYADGTECKLLKKIAMDFIIENGEAVLQSKSYDLLDESPRLRKEVMKAAFTNSKQV